MDEKVGRHTYFKNGEAILSQEINMHLPLDTGFNTYSCLLGIPDYCNGWSIFGSVNLLIRAGHRITLRNAFKNR